MWPQRCENRTEVGCKESDSDGPHVSRLEETAAEDEIHPEAIETCRLESILGSYENCNANVLRALEPSLPANPELKVNSLSANGYAIVVRSVGESSRTFRIKRNAKGILSFPCTAKGIGGCPATGNWGGS